MEQFRKRLTIKKHSLLDLLLAVLPSRQFNDQTVQRLAPAFNRNKPAVGWLN
jgi:hypothetical protein|tara:strand:- start:914 stop:1069 length:156 start_codon:yes stop_codon:yes gene_type:complete